MDPDAELIADAARRARDAGLRNVHFEVGAGQSLPYEDGAFEVVILSWTL
jgi:ubiquinone/menaquinone biosynthesis C-methylase UbiE